jgi:hypothetical protein
MLTERINMLEKNECLTPEFGRSQRNITNQRVKYQSTHTTITQKQSSSSNTSTKWLQERVQLHVKMLHIFIKHKNQIFSNMFSRSITVCCNGRVGRLQGVAHKVTIYSILQYNILIKNIPLCNSLQDK